MFKLGDRLLKYGGLLLCVSPTVVRGRPAPWFGAERGSLFGASRKARNPMSSEESQRDRGRRLPAQWTAEERKLWKHRTAYLTEQGWRVIRFWNEQVNRRIEDVLETIHAASRFIIMRLGARNEDPL
jgi:hypothetical protein